VRRHGRRDVGLFRRCRHRRRSRHRRRRGRRHLSGLRTRARGEQRHGACDKYGPGHPLHNLSPMVMCRTMRWHLVCAGTGLSHDSARPQRNMRSASRRPLCRRHAGRGRGRGGRRRSGARRCRCHPRPMAHVVPHIPAFAPALGITPRRRRDIRDRRRHGDRRRSRLWHRHRRRWWSRLDRGTGSNCRHDAPYKNCVGDLQHDFSPFGGGPHQTVERADSTSVQSTKAEKWNNFPSMRPGRIFRSRGMRLVRLPQRRIGESVSCCASGGAAGNAPRSSASRRW
jgi:hypothetical protein